MLLAEMYVRAFILIFLNFRMRVCVLILHSHVGSKANAQRSKERKETV